MGAGAGHPAAVGGVRGQAGVPRQDVLVQSAQLSARVDTQLTSQHAARHLVGGQRLGVPPAPDQGEHELAMEISRSG